MTTATAQKGVITREELHSSPQFLACTKMQQHWLDLVAFENVDPNTATAKAYNTTDPVYCSMLTGKILSSSNIADALSLVYGYSEKEKFLKALSRDLKKLDGLALIRGRELYARVLGLSGPVFPAESDDPVVYKIGDTVRQDGVLYKVSAVDATGKILEATEI